jgi:hypothetical protein
MSTAPGRAFVLAAALALGGCGYTYHFETDLPRGEEHNEWASFFLFGLVGEYELDVRELCPQGVAEIATGNDFLTWLVSTFTLGIYTPRKVNVWCAAGGVRTSSFEIEFDPRGNPARVTKRAGGATYSGAVRPAGGRRFAVVLREGAVR